MPLPCQCCHPFHVFLLGLVERLCEAQRQRGDTHAFNVSAHALKPLPCLAPSTIREFFLPCQRRLLVSSKPAVPLPCQCCHLLHIFLLALVEMPSRSAHALKPLPCLAPSTIREFLLPCQRRLLVSSKPSAFALHPFHVFLLGLVERLREAQRQPGDAVRWMYPRSRLAGFQTEQQVPRAHRQGVCKLVPLCYNAPPSIN